MVARAVRFSLLASFLALAPWGLVSGVLGQEGHPLKGTWAGDWGPDPTHRNQITIVMDWDGDKVTGILDPGPNAIDFRIATLDPSDWTVHIEIEVPDRNGDTIEYTIDGTLEDIGLPDRRITGTWVHGDQKADFTITRQ